MKSTYYERAEKILSQISSGKLKDHIVLDMVRPLTEIIVETGDSSFLRILAAENTEVCWRLVVSILDLAPAEHISKHRETVEMIRSKSEDPATRRLAFEL